MRPRNVRPLAATYRPLAEVEGDEFGDASVMTSANREAGFSTRLQVTWLTRMRAEGGTPGRVEATVAIGLLRVHDLPRDRRGTGWEPKSNDLIVMPTANGGTVGLFVADVQPAFPVGPSLGRPSGGFDGWRLKLVDRDPAMSQATQYDS